MKTLYFDSSYLFRLYSNEAGAAEVKSLAGTGERVASAWHARAELASILLRKRREAGLPDEACEEIRNQIRDDHESGLVSFLPLTTAAAELLDTVLARAPRETYLRAADAMHLACAAEQGFTEVYSNDRHFLAAASLFGLKGVDVIEKR